MRSFIYPVVVHWVWASDGWLSSFNQNAVLKVIDFAGSGVVHMTGGVAGLCGAIIVGPRIKRFETNFEGQSSVLQALGTLLLWFGWYGFNAGSTLGISANLYARDAARITVTTTLAAAAGGLTSAIMSRIITKTWLPEMVYNGILSGLVSITAGCSVTYPWHAVVIGMIGSVLYKSASTILVAFKIDDPLDAFAVHGVAGYWGVIAAGLFAVPSYSYNESCGAFFGCSEAILAAFAAASIQVIWVSACSCVMFSSLKRLNLLRITVEEEELGMDLSKHGGNTWSGQTL